jgi:N utilization substance protein B
MKRRKAREYALQILYQYEITGTPQGPESLKSFWDDRSPGDDVKSFAEDLAIGTIKNLERIDSLISSVADNWQLQRMAAIDRNILRFATYELLYKEDIPAAVTLNEAIEIAKKFSTSESFSFINGILDRLSKKLKKRLH